MNLPDIAFNVENIERIHFSGAGGKEKLLLDIFASPHVQRVNHSHYDFVVDEERIETKRQRGTNWFDHGKFHDMTEEIGNVLMLFIMHDAGKIRCIAGIRLRDLVDLACADEECQKHGWTYEAMRDAHRLKTRYPALEHKAKLHVDKLLARYPDRFRIYWGEPSLKKSSYR